MHLKFENTVLFQYEFVVSQIGREMFVALNPPWSTMELLQFDGTKVSDEVHLDLKLGFTSVPWVSKIVQSVLTDKEFNFIDIGVKMLPGMKSWHHHHIFRKVDENKTLIIDDVNFKSGNYFLDLFYRNIIMLQFYYRKYAYSNFLKSCQ